MSPSLSLSAKERALFLRLNLLIFFLLGTYGVAQPTCQSLFLSTYGSEGLPWAWLGVTAVSVASVVAVGRLSARLPLWQVMRIGATASAFGLGALMLADGAGLPHAMFVLYIWKDVYIVVLVELFWTFANLAFAADEARTLYGWFCATGTVGGIAGSTFAAHMATRWGTHQVLWTTAPCLLAVALLAGATRERAGVATRPQARRPAWREAPAFLRQSPFVGWLILLVGVVQASMTVMDFQFNHALAEYTHDTDVLTRIMSQVNMGINAVSLLLQVATGPILRLLGLAGALVAIPLALLGTLGAFVVAPGLAAIIAAKVVGKSADYSLFRAAKEMLYIPLSYTEKTFGKALVDILVYRVAKGGVSLVLLALVGLHSARAVSWVSVVLCLLWLWVTWRLMDRYRRLPKAGGGSLGGWLVGVIAAAGLATAPAAARASGEDPTGVGPSFTKPDLFFHTPGQDLSAQRLDCEVFGWNKSFTEVAAVASDIARGPRGKHRGDVYMLVYRLADGRLLHNVITHNVTHPDLPHNPIPLDDVRDLTWTIENPYLNMWPVRPQHRRPRGAMEVHTLVALVPAGGDDELCTPHIGAALAWHGEHRLANFAAQDMTVSCSLLHRGDQRVYWGRDDIAAVMMRFDYNNLPNNEKSARFVQSLQWAQAAVPRIELVGEFHSHEALAALVARLSWAQVDAQGVRVGNPLARALLQVSCAPGGRALAHHLRGALLPNEGQIAAEVLVAASDPAAGHPPAPAPAPAAAAADVGRRRRGAAADVAALVGGPPPSAAAGRRRRPRGERPPARPGPPAGPALTVRLGDPSWRPPPPPDPDHPNADRAAGGSAPRHRPPPASEAPPRGDFIDSWQPP